MHKDYHRAMSITHAVIGAAIEVHRLKGPGLLESIYEKCFRRELELRGLASISQRSIPIEYKGLVFEETLKFDVLIEGCVLVELKSVENVLPIHKAQLLSYMRLLEIPVGLLLNFHAVTLKEGIDRLYRTSQPSPFVPSVSLCSKIPNLELIARS